MYELSKAPFNIVVAETTTFFGRKTVEKLFVFLSKTGEKLCRKTGEKLFIFCPKTEWQLFVKLLAREPVMDPDSPLK